MSSFNTVTKIKYTDNASDLVSLNEYIVFQDDKARRKYIVFKFVNNVTQQLLGMQFEVCQYNAENNLLEKSVVVYNKFLAGAEEEFVPKAKLRVSYDCTSVSVRLIQAAYDRFVWKEGEYKDNCYNFDQFYHDEKRNDADKLNVKERKAREKKPKKKKYKKSRKSFVLKDATTKNFTKMPVVFNVIAFIAVLAFIVGSLFLFKRDAKKFTQGDYLVRIIASGDVAVYGYTGDKTELVIPEKLGSYNVAKIDSGAFESSNITKVTIKCELTIEGGAFKNCKNLTTVQSDYRLTVLDNAFEGCTSLKSVSYPGYSGNLPN
ncbi:MAG: leucine-rich repeat domain-containing protein [Roseburia sp.]|nr:leucine-rich repeat domain-containing protein [Roseburia sp.]